MRGTFWVTLVGAGFGILSLSVGALAVDRYVSLSGQNAYPGTELQPWRNLQYAANRLNAGDTLYIRGGLWQEAMTVSASGSAGAPIRVMPYPGETVIVDGNNYTLPSGSYNPLLGATGNYVQFYGIEVRYSSGMGVLLQGKFNLADGINSHHQWENGILINGTGDNSVVRNCQVWSTCMRNEGGTMSVGWASALSAARHPKNCLIQNNVSHDNWGEGVSAYEAQGTTIEGNVVYDNWSANIYISDAQYTLCRRNLVYATNLPVFVGTGGSQVGIMMGDELQTYGPSANNTIVNNLVVGTFENFFWWRNSFAVDGMLNDLVAYNTFVNSRASPNVEIAASPDHTNTRFINNIMEQDDSRSNGDIAANISVGHNVWSKAPSRGSGAGDVVANPQLAKTGSLAPGALTSDYFLIASTSPARGAALALAEVTDDYFQSVRDVAPDCGAHEYVGTPSFTVTPSPVVSPTSTPTASPSSTATPILSPTPTATATATRTHTPDLSPTPTSTVTPTRTSTPVLSATPTATRSLTRTATATRSPTHTPTSLRTATPTSTPTPITAPAATTRFLSPGLRDGINDRVDFDSEFVEVRILDLRGRQVFQAGGADLRWSGRDTDARPCPAGVYLAKLTRRDGTVTYQSLVIVK